MSAFHSPPCKEEGYPARIRIPDIFDIWLQEDVDLHHGIKYGAINKDRVAFIINPWGSTDANGYVPYISAFKTTKYGLTEVQIMCEQYHFFGLNLLWWERLHCIDQGSCTSLVWNGKQILHVEKPITPRKHIPGLIR